MNTAYHPQTDGQIEVMNRILKDYLRAFIDDSQDSWDDWLIMGEFTMNNTQNASTGETLFFLNYGEHPNPPHTQDIRSCLQIGKAGTSQTEDRVPAVKQYIAQIQQALQMARLQL